MSRLNVCGYTGSEQHSVHLQSAKIITRALRGMGVVCQRMVGNSAIDINTGVCESDFVRSGAVLYAFASTTFRELN